MRRDAIVAVIVATICMLLYIWFRFKDIRFASSAVLALLHDVLVVLAFYAIARVSVGNTFIACMLTIVGYSINATIVIFDRIRENLHSGSREKLAEIVNTSITQTLTRSIYTSFTTFVMVAVLYIMGVSSIREFAAPLMVGVLVGAYSSVCITGALWYVMKKKFAGKGQPAIAAASASAKSSSKPKKARDVSQKDPTQPKKKNRKRVAERLAAILNGTIKSADADALFVFIAAAPVDEAGNVDYTNADVQRMANPAYGESIRPNDIMNDALQAQNDPQQRKDFFAKSLNVYTSAMRAYFNIAEFRASDAKYHWTIEQLAKLPIKWYGGADLSKMHDLTAACLYGVYQGVNIIIPHCWFPVTAAAVKAEEDNIPLFGWQEDGWLSMSNDKSVNHAEIVAWFVRMRQMGFKIAEVGHDRKFCREYFAGMKKAGFKIVDQPQYFYKKSEGFRHIEAAAKNGLLY